MGNIEIIGVLVGPVNEFVTQHYPLQPHDGHAIFLSCTTVRIVDTHLVARGEFTPRRCTSEVVDSSGTQDQKRPRVSGRCEFSQSLTLSPAQSLFILRTKQVMAYYGHLGFTRAIGSTDVTHIS